MAAKRVIQGIGLVIALTAAVLLGWSIYGQLRGSAPASTVASAAECVRLGGDVEQGECQGTDLEVGQIATGGVCCKAPQGPVQ